jgi:hypothetical protein
MLEFINQKLPISRVTSYWILCIINVLICLCVDDVYRPYINANGIDDFGIAASACSFFGTIAAFYFVYARYPQTPLYLGACYTVFGCSVYEFIQPYIKLGTFDWADIGAICLGGIAIVGLTQVINDLAFVKDD